MSQRDGAQGQVVVILRDGDAPGLALEGCVIREIAAGSPFREKLYPGDNILGVNGEAATPANVVDLLSTPGELRVDVFRKNVEMESASHGNRTSTTSLIPAEREKLFQRKDGHSYHFIEIVYKKGLKFGLGIKHYQNKVIVSKTDKDSLSALHLQTMDHIIDINGQPVSDKDVCRELLVKSLQKSRKADMVIERPETKEAKDAMAQALHASQLQPPSLAMGSDIRDIVAQQQQRMKASALPKTGGILRVNNAPKGRVQLVGDRQIIIASDTEGKDLRKVKEPK